MSLISFWILIFQHAIDADDSSLNQPLSLLLPPQTIQPQSQSLSQSLSQLQLHSQENNINNNNVNQQYKEQSTVTNSSLKLDLSETVNTMDSNVSYQNPNDPSALWDEAGR